MWRAWREEDCNDLELKNVDVDVNGDCKMISPFILFMYRSANGYYLYT